MFKTIETGNNQKVEEYIRQAQPGLYIHLGIRWAIRNERVDYSSCVGKIIGKTQTRKGLFHTQYGNIAIELPNGKHFDLYSPEPETSKLLDRKGNTLLHIDRVPDESLLKELKSYTCFGGHVFSQMSVNILHPDDVWHKKEIVDTLERYRKGLEEVRIRNQKAQEQETLARVRKEAWEAGQKAKVEAVDLDQLFHQQ